MRAYELPASPPAPVPPAAFWNEQVRDNTDALYKSVQRLGFQTRTTDYTVSATSIASAADIFASDITFTADGTSAYRIEACFPRISTASNANSSVTLNLVDGSGNDLGAMALVGEPDGGTTIHSPVFVVYYYTPAAGSRSINVRAIRSVANGIIYNGAGGSGARLPSYLAVFGPAIT